MLSLLRQGGIIKSFMGVVVVLIIAAFTLDFRSNGLTEVACAVRVEGVCVEPTEFNALLRLVAPQGASNKQLRADGFTQHAAAGLVERELLLREARRLGVSVSEDELDKELATGRVHFSWPVDAPIPQALAAGRSGPTTGAMETLTYLRVKNSKTGVFDFDIYKRQVQRILRMSHRNFKKRQKQEIIAARVKAMVTAPVRVSEAEVFAQFERQRSTATARTVELEAEWFERFGAPVTADAVRAFAANNQKEIGEAWEKEKDKWVAGCQLADEILFRFPPGADEDARAQQRSLAEGAAALLKAGVPFATVARVYSDAPSASVGGFLGCLTKDSGPAGEALLEASKALKKGTPSDIIESPQGLHIIGLGDKLAAAEAEKTARDAIARRLATTDSARLAAKAFGEALIAAAKAGTGLKEATEAKVRAAVGVDAPATERGALVDLALAHKRVPTMEISRTFNRSGTPLFGIKGDVNAAELVFSLDKDGDMVAEPLELHAGYAVLQLKEKTLATKEQFDKDKAALMRNIQQRKRADVLSGYVSRLKKQAQDIFVDKALTGNQAPASSASPDGSG